MMNELQIVSATMQQVVMDAVANYRVKPFSERDVHTFLLFVHGMNLLDCGFLDDAVKLLAASVNSQNQKGLWVLQGIAKETHLNGLESVVSKFEKRSLLRATIVSL